MNNFRQRQLNKDGFTLIEVVLVLAIGGLIFLLAFIAFQQVSTNRRDTQRRNDAGRILAEVQNASGDGVNINNQTALTGGTVATASGATGSFLDTYFGGSMKGPQADYIFTSQPLTTGTGVPGTTLSANNAVVGYNAKCTTGSNTKFDFKSGSYAVILGLEKGSVCRDDQ